MGFNVTGQLFPDGRQNDQSSKQDVQGDLYKAQIWIYSQLPYFKTWSKLTLKLNIDL